MPLYDFKCESCDHEFEDICKIADRDRIRCPKCNRKVKILITNSHNQDWFKPHWNENFTGEPIYVKSQRHLKELCLKHGVTSRALGDVRNVSEI